MIRKLILGGTQKFLKLFFFILKTINFYKKSQVKAFRWTKLCYNCKETSYSQEMFFFQFIWWYANIFCNHLLLSDREIVDLRIEILITMLHYFRFQCILICLTSRESFVVFRWSSRHILKMFMLIRCLSIIKSVF